MEKEKILSTISEQLGQTSFSQRTLELYVDLNPLAEGVEPDETYFGNAVKFLKGMQGQYDHDVATKVEDIKKNLTPPTTPPSTPPAPTQDEETRKQMAAMQKQIDEMCKERDDNANRKKQEELVQKVKAGMEAKNASDKYVLEKTLQGVTLDEAKSVETLVDEMLAKYDTEFTACRGEGATPRDATPHQGGGKSPVDSYFARKAKKEGWGKKD